MIKKAWGSEEILEKGQYMLKRLVINPGQKTSMHFHYAKTETLYVLSGQVNVAFLDGRETKVLIPGEHLTIEAGKKNAHSMSSASGAIYLEASTPHVDDSERVNES